MKTLTLATIFLSFFSCTKEEDDAVTTSDLHGKWTLVKMSGSMTNFEATGTAMEYQEFYIFNDKGTFTKIRNQNAVQTTATGTYITKNIQDRMYLELAYSTTSEIIGSCYGNQKEELYFSDKNTLSSTWRMCDGPGLDYQKIVIY